MLTGSDGLQHKAVRGLLLQEAEKPDTGNVEYRGGAAVSQSPGHIWQRIKNICLLTGLGGHFATKVCNRRGCSATSPCATSPLKTTVLYTEVRDKGL